MQYVLQTIDKSSNSHIDYLSSNAKKSTKNIAKNIIWCFVVKCKSTHWDHERRIKYWKKNWFVQFL